MSSQNEYCAKTPTPEESPAESIKDGTLPQDGPCVENKEASEPQSKIGSPRGDAESQTRTNTGNNPENPYSASKPVTPRGGDGATDGVCIEEKVKLAESRNPITGLGLNGDGVGGWKPKKTKQREGNPVTGEGYTGPVNIPGVHPVINKNRVPPGGFSSGLW